MLGLRDLREEVAAGGCLDLMAGGAGEGHGGGGSVVVDGPGAFVDHVVGGPAQGDASVEVGGAAVAPGVAVVDVQDGAVAAFEGALVVVAVADGAALRPVPFAGLAADVEDFAFGSGDDAHDLGVTGQAAGGFARQGDAVAHLGGAGGPFAQCLVVDDDVHAGRFGVDLAALGEVGEAGFDQLDQGVGPGLGPAAGDHG